MIFAHHSGSSDGHHAANPACALARFRRWHHAGNLPLLSRHDGLTNRVTHLAASFLVSGHKVLVFDGPRFRHLSENGDVVLSLFVATLDEINRAGFRDHRRHHDAARDGLIGDFAGPTEVATITAVPAVPTVPAGKRTLARCRHEHQNERRNETPMWHHN
jgi:hypothetical protein